MKPNPVLMLVGTECARGKEKEFNDWYNSTFPPLMMKAPGVIRVDRYERVEDDDQYPSFLSIVQLKNEATIKSLNKSKAFKQVRKIFAEQQVKWDIQLLWRVHYRRVYTSEG